MKGLLSTYIQAAMERATYKVLEDGTHFGEIPGLQGVWASGATHSECCAELQEVLEEWLVLKLRGNDAIPEIGGSSLTPRGTRVWRFCVGQASALRNGSKHKSIHFLT